MLDAGRPPDSVEMGLTLAFAPDADAASATFDALRRYRDAGVERVVFVDDPALVPAPDVRMRVLDRYATVISELDQPSG